MVINVAGKMHAHALIIIVLFNYNSFIYVKLKHVIAELIKYLQCLDERVFLQSQESRLGIICMYSIYVQMFRHITAENTFFSFLCTCYFLVLFLHNV